MDHKVFFREEFVSSDKLEDPACPSCKTNSHLVVNGYLVSPREEIYEEGEVSVKNYPEMKSFDVKQILCMNCNTKSFIIDPIIYALQQENSKMAESLREFSGRPNLLN